jgi:hypothetical protein
VELGVVSMSSTELNWKSYQSLLNSLGTIQNAIELKKEKHFDFEG